MMIVKAPMKLKASNLHKNSLIDSVKVVMPMTSFTCMLFELSFYYKNDV